MAPNVMDYEPYIKMVFADPDCQLDYQIIDLKLHPNSPIVKGFFHLLSLNDERWSITAIFKLLEHPFFRRKAEMDLEGY